MSVRNVSQGFPNSIKGGDFLYQWGANKKFCWEGGGILGDVNLRRSEFDHFKPISKLKTIFCKYWTLIKIKISMMHVIAHAHASTHATVLMCVKNSTCHFSLWHLLSGTLEWRKWKIRNIQLNSIFLSLLTFH